MKSYNVTFTICHDEIEAESEEEAIDIALEMSREDIRKYPEVFTESATVTWMNVPISGECRREDHTLCEWLLCDCHCHDNEKIGQVASSGFDHDAVKSSELDEMEEDSN